MTHRALFDRARSKTAHDAAAAFGWFNVLFTPVPSFSHDVLLARSLDRAGYLKRYPAAMEVRVNATVRLAECVHSEGIPTPTFRRTQNGEICALVGESVFTLSSSIGDHSLLHPADCVSLEHVPRFLARLHKALQLAAPSEPALRTCPAMWNSFELGARAQDLASHFRGSADARAGEFVAVVDEITTLTSRTANLHDVPTPSALVHGDFWPGNIIRVGSHEDLLGIVDFDDAVHGPLLLDVAQFADLAHARVSEGVKIGIDLGSATRFARRYASEAGLTSESLARLPEVLVAARVCSAFWIMERHVSQGPSPLDALLDNDIRTIRYVIEHMAPWQDDLVKATPAL